MDRQITLGENNKFELILSLMLAHVTVWKGFKDYDSQMFD